MCNSRPSAPRYTQCPLDIPATALPGPLQTRPTRCSSDPRDYRDDAIPALGVQGGPDSLVHCSTYEDALNIPIRTTYNPRSKHVSFSEMSSLNFYQSDSKYKKSACYSSGERKKMSRDTLCEAHRIKSLAEHHAPPELTGSKAIRFLIESDIILQEEVVGIEHLLIDDMAVRVQKEREMHMATCLAEYQRQKLERAEGTVDWERLARVSNLRSGKAARRARIRAALAA